MVNGWRCLSVGCSLHCFIPRWNVSENHETLHRQLIVWNPLPLMTYLYISLLDWCQMLCRGWRFISLPPPPPCCYSNICEYGGKADVTKLLQIVWSVAVSSLQSWCYSDWKFSQPINQSSFANTASFIQAKMQIKVVHKWLKENAIMHHAPNAPFVAMATVLMVTA